MRSLPFRSNLAERRATPTHFDSDPPRPRRDSPSDPKFRRDGGQPVARGDGRGRRRRLLVVVRGRRRRGGRRGVLARRGAHGVAEQAGGVHQDVAAAVVRAQAGAAVLVQGRRRDARLGAPRRHPRRHLPHRQGRRGRHQPPVRLRALHPDRHHVLHRRLRKREGRVDQFHRPIHCSALPLRHRRRGRRLRQPPQLQAPTAAEDERRE
uniref:Uncharacterized protein n=1 Tax=Oryza glaberrima TaxID=4538 RepID=I1PW50_ORYGL